MSLALLEDGSPSYGVVYAPGMDTVYYGKAGHGSFRRKGGGQSTRLIAGDGEPSAPRGPSGPLEVEGDAAGPVPADRVSLALALCRAAEGQGGDPLVLRHAPEWATAAAQVILKEAGRTVVRCGTSDEVRYNKEPLSTDCLTVR